MGVMEEIWREIKGYEGLYQVSNLGRVKSLEREIVYSDGRVYKYKSLIIKPSFNKRTGYYSTCLRKNGKPKTFRLNRVVAQAFLPNPNNLPSVNHKDENKLNNSVWVNEDGSIDFEKSNLEWCDDKYNSNYGNRCENYRKTRLGDKYKETFFDKKEWYENNKDRISKQQKEYYQAHKKEKSKKNKEWYEKNRDIILAKQREHYKQKKAG